MRGTHGWIEETARDTVEDPDVDHEGEAEGESNVRLDGDVEPRISISGGDGCDGGAGEGEEEKHGCSDEFAQSRHDVYSDLRCQPVSVMSNRVPIS